MIYGLIFSQPGLQISFKSIMFKFLNFLIWVVVVVNFRGQTPSRPDRLGRHSGNEPQDLLRQYEEEKRKIFQNI